MNLSDLTELEPCPSCQSNTAVEGNPYKLCNHCAEDYMIQYENDMEQQAEAELESSLNDISPLKFIPEGYITPEYDGCALTDAYETQIAFAKPRVVHFKKHPYDVYIGRGSKWGNPFTHISDRKTQAQFIVATREEAISKYKEYILSRPDLMADLHELKGKVLGCWCKPKSCHGDVLAELVIKYCMI